MSRIVHGLQQAANKASSRTVLPQLLGHLCMQLLNRSRALFSSLHPNAVLSSSPEHPASSQTDMHLEVNQCRA